MRTTHSPKHFLRTFVTKTPAVVLYHLFMLLKTVFNIWVTSKYIIFITTFIRNTFSFIISPILITIRCTGTPSEDFESFVWGKQRHIMCCGCYCDDIFSSFTFMLPCCIVIDFFLNNQSEALIIQIYSVIKFYMFRASSLPITSAECTVENSWWWAEKMPETCRVL